MEKNATQKIAEKLSEKAIKTIMSTISPINVLTAAVAQYGKPVMCYNNEFNPDPKNSDNQFVAFELYIDPTDKAWVNFNGIGRLVVVERNVKGGVSETDIDTYVRAFEGESVEIRNAFIDRLVKHFMGYMELDYEEMRNEIATEVVKNILAALPSAVVNDVFSDYDVQCYIESCRNGDE
jgi:hypothetical protein